MPPYKTALHAAGTTTILAGFGTTITNRALPTHVDGDEDVYWRSNEDMLVRSVALHCWLFCDTLHVCKLTHVTMTISL